MRGDNVTSDPFPFETDRPSVDPTYPAAGRVPDLPPAPELSDEERATVERFDAALDATLDDPEIDAQLDEATAGAIVPRNMTLDVDGVLDELGDLVVRQTTTAGMKDAVRHTIRTRADERRRAREERLGDDPVKSATDVRRELVGASRDAEVLEALAGVFTAGAKEAKGVVGDTLDELPERGGKPRQSAKVGEDDSFELKITRSGSTKLSTKDEDLDDVLVAIALAGAEKIHDDPDTKGTNEDPLGLGRMPAVTFAAGVRSGISILRSLLGATPGYKSTALDSLVAQIEGWNEDELAKRLRATYGKVPTGEPTIKIEHVERKDGDK